MEKSEMYHEILDTVCLVVGGKNPQVGRKWPNLRVLIPQADCPQERTVCPGSSARAISVRRDWPRSILVRLMPDGLEHVYYLDMSPAALSAAYKGGWRPSKWTEAELDAGEATLFLYDLSV